MAQLITVRLSKSDQQPLGFRLQGGKDFGTPLVVQKVNGGSSAERAGLQAGDALIRVNATDVYTLRHQEAQDAIRAAGTNLELTVQRGGGTWRPQVTPTGSLPRPGSRPLGAAPTPVTSTSLRATPQPNQAFGSGHNNVPKPYGYTNGNEAAAVKSIVNKQYNTPVNMYSEQTIAETLSAQSEVLAGGVLGVNFKKNEKTYDAEKSAVFKVLQEEQNDPEPEPSHFYTRASVARAGTPCCLHRARSGTPRVLNTPVPAASVRPRSSTGTQTPAPEPAQPEPAQLAPEPPHRPSIPVGCHQVLPDGRLVLGAPAQPPVPPPAAAPLPVVADTPHCADCNRYIIGVFVRIKDKNLHVECFKCATCGAALKNQGYYNINQKLYCDIHAALAARQQPPAPHLEPVVVPPGGRIPSNAYSTPLPPLSTNNYTNGSSSMFSPSSNLSGPKPFGSSFGSAYSPSLSPRSAPLSPARHVAAPAPAPVPPPVAPAHAPPAPFTASHAPAAPYAPTNDQHNITTPTLPRSEFKSPAEERLKRKIAKMALNGYEIGIQRRIKPADHIQSMAEKIQETVVSKHPINADSFSSSDSGHSSREGTLKRAMNKPVDRVFKTADNIQSIGDKIKETILNNHPATLNGNVPVPPPIPNSPIPTFHVHSTPIPPPMPELLKKKKETVFNVNSTPIPIPIGDLLKRNNDSASKVYIPNNFFDKNKITNETKKVENHKNGYNSSEDVITDTKIDNNVLKKNNIFDKSSFLNEIYSSKNDAYKTELNINNNYSNTLNKRNIFEKRDNDIHNYNLNGTDKYINDTNTFKNNSVEKTFTVDDEVEMKTNKNTEELLKNTGIHKNLYDNTLYSFRNATNEATNLMNIVNGNKVDTDDKSNVVDGERDNFRDNNEADVFVKRRPKKTDRNSDGRRDSHIVARPLSTMTAVDVSDGQYPVCHVCEKAITRGPFITALGRIWCPEHFVCVSASCRRALQDIGFVEEGGQLYCEYCFEQYIAPACDKCHAKIKGDCLNAIGKHFHPECFNCVYCGKLFGNNPFFLEDGLPYCESDWNELFTTKCFACGFPVEAGDRWVEALNNNYHSQCFNCTVCKKNLEGQSFFAKGGRPFCKLHAR